MFRQIQRQIHLPETTDQQDEAAQEFQLVKTNTGCPVTTARQSAPMNNTVTNASCSPKDN